MNQLYEKNTFKNLPIDDDRRVNSKLSKCLSKQLQSEKLGTNWVAVGDKDKHTSDVRLAAHSHNEIVEKPKHGS